MSNQVTNGGQAFPSRDVYSNGDVVFNAGMTLRDYFAAKAMQGACADPNSSTSSKAMLAAWAYGIADAMLAAREELE